MKQPVSIACIVFSDRGKRLGERLAAQLVEEASFSLSCAYGEDKADLKHWTKEAFAQDQVLVFIGASGIAVRAIAPLVKSKTTDPAVLVMDEAGHWVIPLLSGHIGGANRWAKRVADCCGATPVITTATDVQGVWAVDEWASRRGMVVRNPHNIKIVSAALLRGEDLSVYSDVALTGTLPGHLSFTEDPAAAAIVIRPYECTAMGDSALHLVPACVHVGIGCRKGVSRDDIEAAFSEGLRSAGVVPEAVAALHSIDVKEHEAGILQFCQEHGLPFVTHSAQELEQVEGSVARSEFVRSTVGVDNVCERAALIDASRLIGERRVYNGVTIAVALQDVSYDFEDVQ